MPILPRQEEVKALRWVALVFVAGSLWAAQPLWPPLLLAAWVAVMARPLLVRTSRLLRGRGRAAAILTVLLVLALFLPLVIVLVSLAGDAVVLTGKLMRSEGARNALQSLVSEGGAGDGPPTSLSSIKSLKGVVDLVQQHGATAVSLLGRVAGAAANGALLLFMFFYATYVFLTDGPELYRWLEDHVPIERTSARRLAAAFNETGRGLFVGVGLTGLSQGVVATITYLALGVPRALVLGLLTCAASVLPTVGTALVWVPVAAGLLLSGRPGAAAIMALVGVAVVGSIDNLLRPLFARYGNLKLSTFALLLSIFGGLAAFGGWGVLLGPLLFRMAKEVLALLREARAEADATGGAR
jgi:predicted PurR-regulated permease PerM